MSTNRIEIKNKIVREITSYLGVLLLVLGVGIFSGYELVHQIFIRGSINTNIIAAALFFILGSGLSILIATVIGRLSYSIRISDSGVISITYVGRSPIQLQSSDIAAISMVHNTLNLKGKKVNQKGYFFVTRDKKVYTFGPQTTADEKTLTTVLQEYKKEFQV